MNRRKFLHSLALASSPLAVVSCADLTSGLLPNYLISSEMIMRQLLPNFPFNRNYQGIGQISLTQPTLGFLPDQNKIRMGLGINASAASGLGKLIGIPGLENTLGNRSGRCQIACGLRYDSKTRGIFLKDPVLEQIQLNDIPNQYLGQARNLINTFGPQILERTPIHTLEPSLATRFIGNMTVKQNGIALGFGL